MYILGVSSSRTIILIVSFWSLAAIIKAGDDAQHEWINRTRVDYLRRVDLDGHESQLREGMKEPKGKTSHGAKETNMPP